MITCTSIHTGGLGRFGNTCFSIASTIGIACKNGQPFGFLPWRTADNALFGQPVDELSQYFVNSLPGIPEGVKFQDIPYHWEYRDYRYPVGNWNICSHLQDPRYFEEYMPLIRHYFRMKNEPDQTECVAVHYRAGDYIDNPEAYHPRCSREYYEKAMAEFPGAEFAIFTDDPARARELFNGIPGNWWIMKEELDKVVFRMKYHDPDYLADFACMKRAKSFITANSSFSLFAAILGEHPEKKIVCPSRWFGAQAGGLKFEGYPKNSIII